MILSKALHPNTMMTCGVAVIKLDKDDDSASIFTIIPSSLGRVEENKEDQGVLLNHTVSLRWTGWCNIQRQWAHLPWTYTFYLHFRGVWHLTSAFLIPHSLILNQTDWAEHVNSQPPLALIYMMVLGWKGVPFKMSFSCFKDLVGMMWSAGAFPSHPLVSMAGMLFWLSCHGLRSEQLHKRGHSFGRWICWCQVHCAGADTIFQL